MTREPAMEEPDAEELKKVISELIRTRRIDLLRMIYGDADLLRLMAKRTLKTNLMMNVMPWMTCLRTRRC